MLFSREELINRITRSELLCIPDCLIEEIQENAPDTPEEFTRLLDDCVPDGLTGFDFRDGQVTMTFPFARKAPGKWTAYANLLNLIVERASKLTRVYPRRVIPDGQNDKYLAHCWLHSIGFAGPDFKADRRILSGHLAGYAAFPTEEKMRAAMEKRCG